MVGLTDGEKDFDDMYNRLDSIPACDGRTDRHSGVTSYGALGHSPPLELVQVVIFTLDVCSVAFRCSQKRS